MWNRPLSLNAIADLLFAAGAAMLLAAGVIWGMRQPFAPVREVRLSAPLQHVAWQDLEEAVQAQGQGNFFLVSLDRLRVALEAMPWVRRAAVRRVWPDQLVVTLEEHQPVARWGQSDTEWVNSFGEVFAAPLTVGATPVLPRFSGSADTSAILLRQYAAATRAFAPLGVKPMGLRLSARRALEITLDNGLLLRLGREQEKAPLAARLARFVAVWPEEVAGRTPPPQVADLRYPNGFTLYPKGSRAARTVVREE
ncbi:MAG: FtsQ-type POTRA domain-containing protein [Zoogloeaceae bacterium]|jgi:cell division protein FtsQ|nr:FtsQ-type POTRA domain-containing protein [Zoogloeaceae bacterium]